MLINSYLTFCFLLFSMTTLLQLGVYFFRTIAASCVLKIEQNTAKASLFVKLEVLLIS